MDEYRARRCEELDLHAICADSLHLRQVRSASSSGGRTGAGGRRGAQEARADLGRSTRCCAKRLPITRRPASQANGSSSTTVTQVDIEPPTFVFFCNGSEAIHFSYRRYLENQLREQFAFHWHADPNQLSRTRRSGTLTIFDRTIVVRGPGGFRRWLHRIPIRIALHPVPGTADHLLECRAGRGPAELIARFRCVGNQVSGDRLRAEDDTFAALVDP